LPRYVVDTNLYIRATREADSNRALETFVVAFAPEIYLHSVVALEILAGATTPGLERRTQERFIRPLERRDRVFTPSHAAWKRAASALAQLVGERKVTPGSEIRRSLVNDCLIAASARDHGFVLITDNAKDFERLKHILPMDFVPPWPDLKRALAPA
jgi:predicted nucleic acid-binding protein